MARPPRQIALLVLILAALVPAVAHAAPGAVTLVRGAGSAPSIAEQSFLAGRVWRLHGGTAWNPAISWARRSAYALDAGTAAAHPEWLLKDTLNRQLYINGLPAADFGNADYRAWWLAEATAQAAGLRGLYVEDVYMERRTYRSNGASSTARDPRTGGTITEANWQRYMADLVVALRAALPATEIVHEVLWHKGDGASEIVRALAAADHVAIEKGFNDTVLYSGTGTYGWQTLAGYVERRQASGKAVILDGHVDTAPGITYGIANLLLLDTGRLALGNDYWTAPGNFWPLYNVDLGAPTGTRVSWSNLWRRDFAGGIVLVNETGASSRTAFLGAGFADLAGVPLDRVTLGAGAAAILRKVQVPAPTPTPTPTATPVVTATPTATPTPTPTSTPAGEITVPVATATPAPRRPGRRPSNPTASIAGAAEPGSTAVSVSVSRLSVSGRVKRAVSGYVHVTVQRKRAKGWVTVRRTRPSIAKSGRFEAAIARLASGTYRVAARFEGTGTAQPSRSGYRTRKL